MKTEMARFATIIGMAAAVSMAGHLVYANQAGNSGPEQSAVQKACCCHHHDRGKGAHHCNSRKGNYRFERIIDELGLSEAQKTKVKEIIANSRSTCEPIRKELIGAKRQLREMALTEKTDEAAIRLQAQRLAGIEADLAVHRSKLTAELGTILSAEQMQKFRELARKR